MSRRLLSIRFGLSIATVSLFGGDWSLCNEVLEKKGMPNEVLEKTRMPNEVLEKTRMPSIRAVNSEEWHETGEKKVKSKHKGGCINWLKSG
jgi:hypothetical protein